MVPWYVVIKPTKWMVRPMEPQLIVTKPTNRMVQFADKVIISMFICGFTTGNVNKCYPGGKT